MTHLRLTVLILSLITISCEGKQESENTEFSIEKVLIFIRDDLFTTSESENFRQFFPDEDINLKLGFVIENQICEWSGLVSKNVKDIELHENLEKFDCFELPTIQGLTFSSFDEYKKYHSEMIFVEIHRPVEYANTIYTQINLYSYNDDIINEYPLHLFYTDGKFEINDFSKMD